VLAIGLVIGLWPPLQAFAMTVAAPVSSSVEPLLERLQRHYQTTNSFSAKFVETLTSPGGPTRKRSGNVTYRKPGMIRWEFDPPLPETIIADGTTLFDYDPGLNQVVETPERTAFKNAAVAAFILGAGNLERDFQANPVARHAEDGLEHLALTPKGGGQSIEVGVDPKTLNIVTLHASDALGNDALLQLSNILRNVRLDPSIFKFAPPPGADIVSSPPKG
jgi:outer membrane lipoprotein carrier protein